MPDRWQPCTEDGFSMLTVQIDTESEAHEEDVMERLGELLDSLGLAWSVQRILIADLRRNPALD